MTSNTIWLSGRQYVDLRKLGRWGRGGGGVGDYEQPDIQ
jgi:hypothetical protein